MTELYLHGPEVVEVNDGERPIQTVRSAIIGVVGTAPDSAPAVTATLSVGVVSSNNALTFTSKRAGAAGNEITVWRKNPGANSAALSIVCDGLNIVANLATNSSGAITTTATQLATAIAANTAAAALVDIANTGASTGAGVVSASFRAENLGGGVDEAFPLNTPVLLAGRQTDKIAALGTSGTLPNALDGIFKQTGAVVVVVRVAVGSTESETQQNVIGGVNVSTGKNEGCWAFLSAENGVGYCPRILIAPGFTHQSTGGAANPVTAELLTVAGRLRAVVVKDGPNTTDAAAIADRRNYGSKRAYIVDSRVVVQRNGEAVTDFASGFVAGLMCRVQNEKGFWKSPSNEEIQGIIGVSRPIDFTAGDYSSQANLLNENDVAVIIRHNGFRLWGNRTCSLDKKWAFLSRVIIADMINDSILRNHMWAVDQGITRTYFEDVVAGVRSYLRRLKNQDAIAGGDAWADKNANTADVIAAGQAIFDFDFSDTVPAERVTFRSRVTNRYLEEIL